jgi:hypothetical protein
MEKGILVITGSDELHRILKKYFENLHSNKLKHVEDIDTFMHI